MSGIAGTHGTLRKGCKLSLLSSVSLMESSSFLSSLSFLPVSRDACKFVLFSHRREPLWIERRSGLQLSAHAFSLLPPVVYLTRTAHICIYTLWEASSGFLRTVFPSQFSLELHFMFLMQFQQYQQFFTHYTFAIIIFIYHL